MNLTLFFIQQILREMWRHKLRSSLAIFCIAFGTFAVVTLLALGDGFYRESYQKLLFMADGSYQIYPGQSSKSYLGYPQGQPINIKAADIVALPNAIQSVAAVSLEIFQTAKISYADKTYTKNLYGVTPDHIRIAKTEVTAAGRFINNIDIAQQARVTVIGDKVKTQFFGQGDPLGLKILIDNIPFTVVGVLLDKEKSKNSSYDDELLISYQSYIALYGNQPSGVILVLPKPETDPIQFEQSVRSYFAQKYHFDKNDKEALYFWSAGEQLFKYVRWFLLGLQLFLGSCGIMTLAVGCIGVANIMFLIITERTYEIGLRKAVGATNRQIFLQLLLEALMIIAIGGGLGFSLAFFTITLLQYLTLPSWLGAPVLSLMAVTITIAGLALIGLGAGFFPARKAAQIDPMAALLGQK